MKMNQRKNFLFYLNWEDQLSLLDDHQHRIFIKNLINYHRGEEVILSTDIEKMLWLGILPALEVNTSKWVNSAEKSRENGKSGGRPPKQKETQQVNDEPKKPVNSKNLIENSKILNGNIEEEIENYENDNSKVRIQNDKTELPVPGSLEKNKLSSGVGIGEYYRNKIEELEQDLKYSYPHYPNLLKYANPIEIKNLWGYVNKDERDIITQKLTELMKTRYAYSGSYD